MDLMTFNVFGEARVKADTVIITATGVKSLAGTVFNEVEIVDLENKLPIDPEDPVRYLFVTMLGRTRPAQDLQAPGCGTNPYRR